MFRKLGLTSLLNIANCDYDRDTYKEHIGQTMTWGEFKKIFPNYEQKKLIRTDMTHYEHKYTIGFNKVPEFKPWGYCSEGGFYFADETDIYNFLSYGDYFAKVTIPDDTPVYIENGKIKVESFYLDGLESKKTYINEHPNPLFLIKYDRTLIRFMDNPSIEVQNKAIEEPWNIEYICNPDKEIQKKVVSSYGYLIKFIEKPDEELQLIAVRQCGHYIKQIKNPTTKVQLEAIKKDKEFIRFIENPDEEVQLIAVRQDGEYISHIKNPTTKVQLEAIKQDKEFIRFIENPDEEVQLIAIMKDMTHISHIKNPTKKVQLEVIKQDIKFLEYIENPDFEVYIYIMKNYGLFSFIDSYYKKNFFN